MPQTCAALIPFFTFPNNITLPCLFDTLLNIFNTFRDFIVIVFVEIVTIRAFLTKKLYFCRKILRKIIGKTRKDGGITEKMHRLRKNVCRSDG